MSICRPSRQRNGNNAALQHRVEEQSLAAMGWQAKAEDHGRQVGPDADHGPDLVPPRQGAGEEVGHESVRAAVGPGAGPPQWLVARMRQLEAEKAEVLRRLMGVDSLTLASLGLEIIGQDVRVPTT